MTRLKAIWMALAGQFDDLIEYGKPANWAIEEDHKGEHLIYTGPPKASKRQRSQQTLARRCASVGMASGFTFGRRSVTATVACYFADGQENYDHCVIGDDSPTQLCRCAGFQATDGSAE